MRGEQVISQTLDSIMLDLQYFSANNILSLLTGFDPLSLNANWGGRFEDGKKVKDPHRALLQQIRKF